MLAGAAGTALVVAGAAVAGVAIGADLVPVVLGAGLVGGLVAGLGSDAAGHVGAGARAGAYGSAAGFAGFVAVGTGQAILGGEFSILVVGIETLLIALLVVPLHALLGAVATAVGVRVRRPFAGRSGGT